MPVLIILSLIALGTLVPHGAAYADEFGERFYGQTPQGLGDFAAEEAEISDIATEDISEDLDNIMPAAGEEETNTDAIDADASGDVTFCTPGPC